MFRLTVTRHTTRQLLPKAKQDLLIERLGEQRVHWEKAMQDERALRKRVRKVAKEAEKNLCNTVRDAADAAVRQWEADDIKGQCCIHVDMDMFYAAVECRENPELREVPVAVGTKSIVTTANYVAREYGVRSAMPGFVAEQLVAAQGGELHFIKPRKDIYKAVSSDIMATLKSLASSSMCRRSIDEAYLNVTNLVREGVAAGDLAVDIQRKISEKTGLTCSIGIAGNMTVAKLASNVNRPNGWHAAPVERNELLAWLSDKPVRSIHGVGEKTENLLKNALDIHTMGDVYEKRHLLIAAFGATKKTGFIILKNATGFGPVHMTSTPQLTIGAEKTFHSAMSHEESQLKALRYVIYDARRVLGTRTPKAIILKITKGDLTSTTRKVRIPSKLRSPFTKETAVKLAQEGFLKSPPDSVKLIGVRFQLAGEDERVF